MSLYLVLVVQVLNHTCFRGSKVLLTLFAIELGASPLVIGIAFAMYSLLPAFLSVYAGRLSDRIGCQLPMLLGSIGMLAGMLVPWLWPGLVALFISATVTGSCYIFYTVSVQTLVGSLGDAGSRTRNYSLYSLCVGMTALFGPVLAGFAIEHAGGARAYLLMAALPVVPILVLALLPGYLPLTTGSTGKTGRRSALDLLRNPSLRRILLVAGILEAGAELANFLLPIYADSVGLSPSRIGLVMGSLAAALLVVRALIPFLVARSSEAAVLGGSMFVSGLGCLLMPFVDQFVPLLTVSFLLGLGIGCGAPLSMVLVFERSPSGRSGEAMGLRQTVNKGTEVVVPVLFGSASTAFGMLPVFWVVAALLAAGGLIMSRDARQDGRPGIGYGSGPQG